MADLVTGSDILLRVGLAALAGRSEFRLRRGQRHSEGKYRKTPQNLTFHFLKPPYRNSKLSLLFEIFQTFFEGFGRLRKPIGYRTKVPDIRRCSCYVLECVKNFLPAYGCLPIQEDLAAFAESSDV
jgi:hypothetical protein